MQHFMTGSGLCPSFPAPYYNDSSSLLIRHLPEDFSLLDVEKFLKDAGAIDLKYFGNTGRLRNIAIADFGNPGIAVMIMQRFHQIRLGKRRLVVEFASEDVRRHHPSYMAVLSEIRSQGPCDSENNSSSLFRMEIPHRSDVLCGEIVARNYKYPPANTSTLTNMMYSIGANQKLYTEVLHLMNAMNLPIPFGPTQQSLALQQTSQEESTTETPMDLSSGSEAESEVELDLTQLVSNLSVVPSSEKSASRPRKKRKIASLDQPGTDNHTSSGLTANSVFGESRLRKTGICIQPPSLKSLESQAQEITTDVDIFGATFGKFSAPECVNPNNDCGEAFISQDELEKQRASEEESSALKAFKNYNAGTPCAKLYIKNIANSVEEEDLRFIFGRYVNWKSQRETESFEIRLMQEGRMKGQAFVTLPSQIIAEAALKDVNRYILKGKPLAVTFSRSVDAKSV